MRQVTITISDEDWDVMLDSVMDPEQWIRDALAGKIYNCRKRMQRPWIDKLRREGATIPADDPSLEALIKGHPDYRNRSRREEIAQAQSAQNGGE